MLRRRFLTGVGALGLSGCLGGAQDARLRRPDVIFVPTHAVIVDAMLRMAQVTGNDTVYDLGCGDGRIVITAALKYGARGVGIDIDPERIKEATANARDERVADRVRFVLGDLFEADISPATVVTLYLLTELNLKLRPKLLRELNPGTRIVSHAFGMGDWKPEREVKIGDTPVYLWRIPPRTA
jgi:SAM-dependent methyltransferase